MVPAVIVTAARGANKCAGAGLGLGCCVVAQTGLGIGRQRQCRAGDGGTGGYRRRKLEQQWLMARAWQRNRRLGGRI